MDEMRAAKNLDDQVAIQFEREFFSLIETFFIPSEHSSTLHFNLFDGYT